MNKKSSKHSKTYNYDDEEYATLKKKSLSHLHLTLRITIADVTERAQQKGRMISNPAVK